MLKELDVGKKDVASELIKNAPGTPRSDFVIRNRLNRLKDRQEFNNDNNNNNLSLPRSPPSPPTFFPQQPPPQPPPPAIPRQQPFLPPPTFSPFQPPPPLPPPPIFPTFQQNFCQQQQFSTQLTFPSTDSLFGSETQTLTREKKEETKDKVLEEIDDKIYKIPDLPKLELGDALANLLGPEAEDILKEEFVNSKKLEDETLENIQEEYNFDEIKDAFDDASVPKQLEFFYGGDNDNFVQACNFLSPNEDNNEFISFLCSDYGQNIMTNNSLSIHIKTGNIFYQNFNTNENFYSFLLAQQDETKAIIPKCIAYHYSFEKYIKNYLPSFSVDDIEKFDLCANKNSKYLLYKFNDWIESLQRVEKLIS